MSPTHIVSPTCADFCNEAEMVSLMDSDVNLHPTTLYEDCSYNDEEASLPLNEENECCFACGCDIVERSELCEGEPALFCEGEHQQWAHARCFNISDDAYKALSNSSELWICHLCNRTDSNTKIECAKKEADWSEILARMTSLENMVCSLQQDLRDERTQKMNEQKVLQEQIGKLEARISIMESCFDLCSARDKPTSSKRKKKSAKRKRKGKQRSTTPVVSNDNIDDSNSDTDVSASIPIRNRFDLLADGGLEDSPASTESDHVEREESSQVTVPLFKCPTVRYIWGTRFTTTETEVENAIAQLGVNQVSFRIERRESTIKGKQVWYFALLANQGTIEQITRSWTLPWKINFPSQTSSGSQSFLYNCPNTQPPRFLYNHPNPQPSPFLYNHPNPQPSPFLYNHPNAQPPPPQHLHNLSNHHPSSFQFLPPYPHCQMFPVPFNQLCQSHNTSMNLVSQRMRKMPVPLLPVGVPRA